MIRYLVLVFTSVFITASLRAQIKLPHLISDGMVLQRNAEVNIWGWAAPGEEVQLEFIGESHATVTGSDGKWNVVLQTGGEGGPFTMSLRGSNEIKIRDILLGDVWVCSGQSNMELPMRRVRPLYEQDIAAASNAFIRYFEVPKTYNFKAPQEQLPGGRWQHTTPETVLNFSAAAYFFAEYINRYNEVPVGIILTALGGSPVEAWMSEDVLFPEDYKEAVRFREDSLISAIRNRDNERIGGWYAELNANDLGYKGGTSWKNPGYDDKNWTKIEVPGYWADNELGNTHGVVWYRRHFSLPAELTGKSAHLNLGRIVDADSVFINGRFVGNTGYQYPPRWYQVPEGILKDSRNTIAIRIINERGKGGFVLGKPYVLVIEGDSIPLTGEWKYKLGKRMDPLDPMTFIRWKPMGLFNAMISPLLNYRIKGVIWYQGESNTSDPEKYRNTFPLMIRDWRKHWNHGDFPFLFVQLANFMEASDQPRESQWAELREAQRHALSEANTGMVTTIDIGEWNDIHPLNKKDVGTRLALAAQKVAYGKDIIASGPMVKSVTRKENTLEVEFQSIGSGLHVKGDKIQGFAIAGPDNQYHWAEAKIEGNRIILSSHSVNNPTSVRYAWADNPDKANLYNREGLPAPPFQYILND